MWVILTVCIVWFALFRIVMVQYEIEITRYASYISSYVLSSATNNTTQVEFRSPRRKHLPMSSEIVYQTSNGNS
jgi:hypothetical protein